MSHPEGAQLSPDGNYWWDGHEWQPVPGGAADTSSSVAAAAGQPSSPDAAGGAEVPTDAGSEQALLAYVNEADAHDLAQQIAAAFGIGGGTGADQLNTSASDPSQMPADYVRDKCYARCESFVLYDGETFVLVDCGDGTCPTCPTAIGKLIVRHWCAYVGYTSHRNAVVLHLLFGATLGPFLV